MRPYTRNMNQHATYWPPGSNDGFGGTAYGTPTPLKCRWQNKQVLFRDTQGREVVSEAVVYVSVPLANGGRLALGAMTDPTPPETAKEIRAIQDSPNLRANAVLHKVVL